MDGLRSLRFSAAQYSLLEDIAGGEPADVVARKAQHCLDSFYDEPSSRRLVLGVNDICNLQCTHCFYISTHESGKHVARKEYLRGEDWQRLIDRAIEQGVRSFSIEGKEPLLTPETTLPLLVQLQMHKEKFPEVRYDLLTNGIFLPTYAHDLAKYGLNRLIVSVDGYEGDHDAIRGKGTYAKAMEGIKAAVKAGVKNITVTYTATPASQARFPAMVRELLRYKISELGIGFFFPLPFASFNEGKDVDFLFLQEVMRKEVGELAQEHPDFPMMGLVTGQEHPHLIASLYRSGWLSSEHMAVPLQKVPQLSLPLSGFAFLQVEILPLAGHSELRIECDGRVGFDYRMVADVREFSRLEKGEDYGKRDLWKEAREPWEQYTERYYARLGEVFGKVEDASLIRIPQRARDLVLE